jgi:hypothetical protein
MSAIKTLAAPEELAKSFASFCPADTETLKKEFTDLNSAAHEQATLVPVACNALSTALGGLMPILSKMQSLLSQRGGNRDLFRDAGVPTWLEWWTSYQKKTGMGMSLRTIQRKLKMLRSMGKPMDKTAKRVDPPVRLSSRDQRRVLTALQCANEIVAAINGNGDYHDSLIEYNRIALDTDRIEQLLENIPDDAEVTVISRTAIKPTPAVPVPAAETPIVSQEGSPQPLPLRMPKGGDHSALFEVINDSCGKQISAALDGLDPVLMATVIGECFKKLANLRCLYDLSAGEITVSVNYVKALPSAA